MAVPTFLGKLFFDFGSTHFGGLGQPMFGLCILVGGIGWGPSRHGSDILVQWEWQFYASSSKAGSRFTSATKNGVPFYIGDVKRIVKISILRHRRKIDPGKKKTLRNSRDSRRAEFPFYVSDVKRAQPSSPP